MHDAPHRRPQHAVDTLAALAARAARFVHEEVAAGRPADATLARLFREHREYGSRDRRFISELAFSSFRWRGWTGAAKPDNDLVVSYLLDSSGVSAELDALARKCTIPHDQLKPLGHCDLAEKARLAGTWLGRTLEIGDLVPAWVRPALQAPPGDAGGTDRCIAEFQRRPPTWLRAAHGSASALGDALRADGFAVDSHPTLVNALAVAGAPNLRALPRTLRGRFEVQDLASQCVGVVCSPHPGERWWDVCAGSGGKALHLADLMGGQGDILATDVRDSALAELDRRARAAGASCIRARRADAPPAESFDGVLVDAPCSGLGTWSRNPDARWRTDESRVRACAETQLEILNRSAAPVRPGGQLVYSVCTLTSAETVGVVDAFRKAHPQFEPDPAVHPLTGERANGPFWIWPWDGPCDGMFVARMRKTG